MAFRLQLIRVVPKTAITKPSFSIIPARSPAPSTMIPFIPSPLMSGNAIRPLQPSFASPFQLCAVPKKRTSPRRKKVRAQGRWLREAHQVYKPYQICLECRRAMRPGMICTVNKDCMNQPRF